MIFMNISGNVLAGILNESGTEQFGLSVEWIDGRVDVDCGGEVKKNSTQSISNGTDLRL